MNDEMKNAVGSAKRTAPDLLPLTGVERGNDEEAAKDQFETVGDYRCCAWRCGCGVVRLQVRDPRLAWKLEEIEGGRRSGYSVGGDYLELFDFEKPFSWAREWVKRHAKVEVELVESEEVCRGEPQRDETIRQSVSAN